MTRYYATINGRAVGASGLNAEISNIKCPICGQKMDIVRIEPKGRHFEKVSREEDKRGHLIHSELWSDTLHIKWRCQNCTAELSATAKNYRDIRIDLDKYLDNATEKE